MTEEGWRRIDFIVKSFGVVAILFGVWKHFNDISLDRDRASDNRSIQMVEEYGTGELADSRETLSDFWFANSDFASHINSHGAPEATKQQYIRILIENDENRQEIIRSALVLSSFYDRVGYCISSQSCSADIACDYFDHRAISFGDAFGLVLEELRAIAPYIDVGDGIQGIVERCASS